MNNGVFCHIIRRFGKKRASYIFREEMEVTLFSEMFLIMNHILWSHTPEENIVHNHYL
jgi:hypothetical protein